MMTPADLKIAYDTIKALAATAKEVDRMPLYAQALDLYRQMVEATQEISELQKRVRDLEEQVARRATVRFAMNAVWFGDGFDPANGPFCPACYGDGREVHMTFSDIAMDWAFCPKCKATSAMTVQAMRPGTGRSVSEDY